MDGHEQLDRLEEGQVDIGRALARLEQALARPIGTRSDWMSRVDLALDDLLIVGRTQVAALLVEGGALDDAVRSAPRLAGKVDRLRRGLPEVEREAELLQKQLPELDPSAIRRRLVQLLGRVVGHRHIVADTIWTAYNVDLGGAG